MKMITILMPWKIDGEGGEEVVGLWLLRRSAMNIVDKLTPNSKTVVNTEKKKTFWMLLILLLNHAKKRKKITIKTVMHRGFSIQNCTFSALFNRVQNFFSLFSIVCDSETEKSWQMICGSDSNVLKMFSVTF